MQICLRAVLHKTQQHVARLPYRVQNADCEVDLDGKGVTGAYHNEQEIQKIIKVSKSIMGSTESGCSGAPSL